MTKAGATEDIRYTKTFCRRTQLIKLVSQLINNKEWQEEIRTSFREAIRRHASNLGEKRTM